MEDFNNLNITGNLTIQEVGKHYVMVSGNITCSDKTYTDLIIQLKNKYLGKMVLTNNLKRNTLEVFANNFTTTNPLLTADQLNLDEVQVVFSGMIPTNMVHQNNTCKVINQTNKLKLDNCVRVLKVISPIVVNQDLKVIDGDLRVQLALENNIKEIPCLIINCDKDREDVLRLILNRSNEFQRWEYREVDAIVDRLPQTQALVEPLGFFGTKVLPTSFFANTILSYVIDPFNEKQKQYRQEVGVAAWAKYRREEMEKAQQAKYAKKKPKITESTVSLFSLKPTEKDFLETYDPQEEIDKWTEKWTKRAEHTTELFDTERKAVFEEQGRAWQGHQRSSKQFAEDNRKAFIEKIQSSNLNESYKEYALDNIEEFANLSIKDIESKLDEVFSHE